jgi:hypothetical protein
MRALPNLSARARALQQSTLMNISVARPPDIETHSLPTLARRYPRDFTLITRSPRRPRASYPSCVAVYPLRSRRSVFYVADLISSIETHSLPTSLAATLAIRRTPIFVQPVIYASDRAIVV